MGHKTMEKVAFSSTLVAQFRQRIAEEVAGALADVKQRVDALETWRTASDAARVAQVATPTPSPIDMPQANSLYLDYAPAGHYYSTIPDRADLLLNQDRIFSRTKRPIPGIAIDDAVMTGFLDAFAPFYKDFPFVDEPRPDMRFHMDNTVYSRGDAVVLYSMIRLLEPKRIVEVGSGMSTCLLLDVNRLFFNNRIDITSIDPFPERMMAMIGPEDRAHLTVVPKRLQDMSSDFVATLQPGDILFFDSTHVSKCDSDVNHIFFELLPAVAPGVHIHFHDMFYPFEYPKQWLLDIGAAWNELYLMRAFLSYNRQFRVNLFSDYLGLFHAGHVARTIPAFMRGIGGSLWLERVRGD